MDKQAAGQLCPQKVQKKLFFPVGETGPAQRQIAAAKAVCRCCPVIEDCLAWALHARHEDGVWGGQDMAERRALHRRTRAIGVNRAPGPEQTPRALRAPTGPTPPPPPLDRSGAAL